MTTTYLIAIGLPTKLRGRYLWFNIHRSKSPPPPTYEALHPYLLDIVQDRQIETPCILGLTRTHGRKEKRGFHGNIILRLDETGVFPLKKFSGVKGIPGHSWFDFEWKERPGFGSIAVEKNYVAALDTSEPPEPGEKVVITA